MSGWNKTRDVKVITKVPLVPGSPPKAISVNARLGVKYNLSVDPYCKPLACRRTPGLSAVT